MTARSRLSRNQPQEERIGINWNIIDTINGAQASATAYSIAEAAKANNLKPYEYFRYLLTELAERVDTKMDAQFTLEDLMP